MSFASDLCPVKVNPNYETYVSAWISIIPNCC